MISQLLMMMLLLLSYIKVFWHQPPPSPAQKTCSQSIAIFLGVAAQEPNAQNEWPHKKKNSSPKLHPAKFLVLSCIFSVFLSAGIARSPTASVGRLFSPHCPEDFVEDRKHSLSFSGAGRLAVTRVSDASFSSYHDVTHPAVQVVCSTQNRVTRQSVWRPFLARDSEWKLYFLESVS